MNGDPLLLVLDEGTSSTRALLYRLDGALIDTAQMDIAQHYPRPGWVEHDPTEIWEHTLACGRAIVERAGGAARIAAIGITNQRETAVAWDRVTGTPLTRAIVWQDRRTADACSALRQAGHEPLLSASTGLVLDPYFSATKWRWMLDHVPAVADAGERLALGTIESWLVWKLSGGAHVSDASNASRTMLAKLDGPGFDTELCELFGIPRASLPEVVDMAGLSRRATRNGSAPRFRYAGWQATSNRRPSARAARSRGRPRRPLARAPSFSPPWGRRCRHRSTACWERC